MGATNEAKRFRDEVDEDKTLRAQEMADLKAGTAALQELVDTALAIDAVDDVAKGFREPKDEQRVAAARQEIAKGLREVLPNIAHCLSLAELGAGGVDPEQAVFALTGVVAHARELRKIARRASAKLGKVPPRDRVAAGRRLWRAHQQAALALRAKAREASL
jgi:HEAT repeat protein